MQFEPHVVDVWILVDMIDSLGIKRTGPSLDAMNDIALFQ
jgi:hypothetical protein